MPLQRSGSKSSQQALAIAYNIKRRNREDGGAVEDPLFLQSGQIATPPPAPYQRGDFQRSGPQMRATGPLESIKNAFDVHKPWGIGDTINAALMAVPGARGYSPKLFHGTTRASANAIKQGGFNVPASGENAVFLTDTPKDALDFAYMKRGASPNNVKLVPGYVDEGPLYKFNAKGEVYDPDLMARILDEAKAAGAPGAKISNIQNFEYGEPSTSYAIFDPKTINVLRQSGKDGNMARGGALDVAYALKRNRRFGGRLNRAEGGEAFLPESEMPETEPPQAMPSGVGPNVPPFTRRQAELEDSDPFERAALRTRESVRPTSGRKDGPLMGLAGTALAVGAGPEAMLANYAPRAGAALYGLMGGMTPSEAGEQNFTWNDPLPDRAKEMAAIQQRIDQRAATIQTLGTTSTKSPAGTQKLAIDNLSALNSPTSPDVTRLNQLRTEAAAERDAAFQQWQTKQEEDRLAAIERKKAETSLFDKVPGTRAAITVASPVASFLGGKYLGRRLSPYAAIPIGATTGAAEGAASIGFPTEIDINSLPRSSSTRQEAEADLDKQSYWQRVGLAAGVSGLSGGLGAVKGYASTRSIRKPGAPDVKPPSSLSETSDAMQKAVQASKKKSVPAEIHHMPDGTVMKKFGSSWHNGKQWVKAADVEAMKRGAPVSPPSTLHAPPMEARGGGIRSPMDVAYAVRRQKRADGGAVHAGPILSSVPGRTDNHPMDVASGSYVMPADHVSSLGEGNTSAGMEVLQHMLGGLGADGAESQPGQPVPINAAGGEFVISPHVVAAIGGGDIARGHKMLDEWVLMNRKKHIRTLSKLPGPAKA